jgi:hypothetical protein
VMGNLTCTSMVNSLYKISVPIAAVLRPFSETCSCILVIDRHVPERRVFKVSVAAEGWFGISCHRFDMNLEKAPGKRHGSCSSVRNRPEQGCTNCGYRSPGPNKLLFTRLHAGT